MNATHSKNYFFLFVGRFIYSKVQLPSFCPISPVTIFHFFPIFICGFLFYVSSSKKKKKKIQQTIILANISYHRYSGIETFSYFCVNFSERSTAILYEHIFFDIDMLRLLSKRSNISNFSENSGNVQNKLRVRLQQWQHYS